MIYLRMVNDCGTAEEIPLALLMKRPAAGNAAIFGLYWELALSLTFPDLVIERLTTILSEQRGESVSCCKVDIVRIKMIARSPGEAVEMLDKAFNEGDVETLLSFYEDAAIVVTEPGHLARGRSELRTFFNRVVRSGMSAKQLKTYTLEADGIALFLSRWSLQVGTEDAQRTFVATTVFRKQPDGGWRALIDNSVGPSVLES